MKAKAIVIHPADNVATALRQLRAGSRVEVDTGGGIVEIVLEENIPQWHKLSLRRLEKGGRVLKYGQVIGRTTADVEAGRHVHVHNLASCRAGGSRTRKVCGR